MEDATLATFSYGGQRRVRGTRKARGLCWDRIFRTLLVCVCVIVVAGGITLAGLFPSPQWESGGSMAGIKLTAARSKAFLSTLRSPEHATVSVAMGDKVAGAGEALAKNRRLVSRIGFGSCTSRVAIAQPIWETGVIPSNIDAWIWCESNPTSFLLNLIQSSEPEYLS